MKTLTIVICSAAATWGIAAAASAQSAKYSVAAPSISIGLTDEGEIVGRFSGRSELDGCHSEGKAIVKPLASGYAFTRTFADARGHRCTVTDRFTPTKTSIRWEMEVTSDAAQPWTTPLVLQLKCPATPKTRFWTPWVNGNLWDDSKIAARQSDPATTIADGDNWGDPLVPMPLMDKTWDYGNGKGTICIPVGSMLEPETDTGVSLVVAPDQPLLWLQLATRPDGTLLFRHKLLRLGGGRKATFTADIVAHEADWRGGLRWMTGRYAEYFNPPNPKADAMAGTASYAYHQGKFDPEQVARLKKMAYRTNWAATFDWPYYVMYLPPMPNDEACWETSGHNSTAGRDPARVRQMSYRKMNDECRHFKEQGFHMLSYFMCTEFGSAIGGPDRVKKDLPESESWRDANTLLYRGFRNGIYREENGGTLQSWSLSVVMDPGDPRFQAYILEQAGRIAAKLPDSDGICIDRMDWLTRVNYAPGADDKVGWYASGRPGRLLALSWIDLMSKLGPIMHGKDKVIFVNSCVNGHRIDLFREVDGIYDEFGQTGYSLNGSSMLAIRKPAMMWTPNAGSVNPDPDSYFQRHLHMGAYPTAPFPGNDHTLTPDPKVDGHYLAYGPLLDAMRGKKWVLEPHCVESAAHGVKVNLFHVPAGLVLPVTFGGKAESVTVRVRNIRGLDKARCEALQPGVATALPVASTFQGGVLELHVPLKRGCAMVRIGMTASGM